ncbi:hypothetical protein E1200_06405 [Actinomadura sp. GC306]|uniref:DUF5719 family protein n=1 Tax=Actinomadura sp. GC306 TaxID=2530367 RepID=UPI001051C94B|nr:DUF5719 family protein [Actinomadura sp. GC306]TDC70106.1 hypothetical protein E1200_06405 [Actinomadura sp. GC306]
MRNLKPKLKLGANLKKPNLTKPSFKKPNLKVDVKNVNLEKVLRLLTRRYATAALVLVALASLYGAASFSRPGEASENGRAAFITTAVMVCPGHEGGRLAMQSLPDRKGGGSVALTPTKGGPALGAMSAPGQGWDENTKSGEDSYTLRATGAMAAGLEAEQTTHWGGGNDRGLAGARCATPGTDHWFLGPGPDTADELDLYLTNVDGQPAFADLTALSGEGPLESVDGRGIRVDPYTTRVVKIGESTEGLGDVVRSAADLGLRVRTTTGRVAASVRVRIGEKKGIEWLPRAHAAAPSLIVPGVPDGDGERRLVVAVPGESDAQIRVQVITAEGTYNPQGREIVDAPARTVTSVGLDRALLGKAAAVRLLADRPIIAGFAAKRGADVGYGTATPPLTASGPGIVADNRFDSALLVSAPAGAATVQVRTLNAEGTSAPKDVEIPAGSTVRAELEAPPGTGGKDAAYGAVIVPKPGSGPVHASRVLATGKGGGYLFTVLPIIPARTTLHLPDTADSQTALIPG